MAMCPAPATSRSGGYRAGLARSRCPLTPSSWSTVATVRGRSWPRGRYGGKGSRVLPISRGTSPSGGVPVCVKRHNVLLVIGLTLAVSSSAAAQQVSERDEVSPRITRFETWLKAVEQHRPGDPGRERSSGQHLESGAAAADLDRRLDDRVAGSRAWRLALLRHRTGQPVWPEPAPGVSAGDQPLATGAVHDRRVAAAACQSRSR